MIPIGKALEIEVEEDRSTIDWVDVIYEIMCSLQYLSIKEIQENFVKGAVQDQRIKLVVDEAFEKGILDRRLYENMHIYGVSRKFEPYVRRDVDEAKGR